MRLSTRGRYAVRAMLDLAQHSHRGPVPREDISQRQEISALYLAQLFARLAKVGLIESVKGPGGGYLLAREAAEVRAGDIVRAVEGSLAPVFCLEPTSDKRCERAPDCVTHLLWKRVEEGIEEVLDGVTLADLCRWAEALHGNAQEGQGETEPRHIVPPLGEEQAASFDRSSECAESCG